MEAPDSADRRLLIGLSKRPKATKIDLTKVLIRTWFYDALVDNEIKLHESAATGSLKASADWSENPLILAIPYQAEASAENPRKYFGYIVRAYYDGQLQSVRAEPAKLLNLFPLPSKASMFILRVLGESRKLVLIDQETENVLASGEILPAVRPNDSSSKVYTAAEHHREKQHPDENSGIDALRHQALDYILLCAQRGDVVTNSVFFIKDDELRPNADYSAVIFRTDPKKLNQILPPVKPDSDPQIEILAVTL